MLELFDRRNHPRLHFTKADEDTIDEVRVWVIRYEERSKPTIIMTPQGRDVPTSGLAWVDPVSGELIRAEVNIKDFFAAVGFGTSKAQMRVYFREDPKLKFWVPARLDRAIRGGRLGHGHGRRHILELPPVRHRNARGIRPPGKTVILATERTEVIQREFF